MGLLSNIFGGKTKANASVTFEVSMSCGRCVKRIEDMFADDKAVAKATVDLSTKTVSLDYDNEKTSDEKLQASLEGLGFDVSKK